MQMAKKREKFQEKGKKLSGEKKEKKEEKVGSRIRRKFRRINNPT